MFGFGKKEDTMKEAPMNSDKYFKVRESSVIYDDVIYEMKQDVYDALPEEDKKVIDPYTYVEGQESTLVPMTEESVSDEIERVLYHNACPIAKESVEPSEEYPMETQIEGGWVSKYAK